MLAKFRLSSGVFADLEIFVGQVEEMDTPFILFLYSAYTHYSFRYSPLHTKLHSWSFSDNLN